ncbi:hypothetical protein MLD52_18020 [Puniceicoccaceae bacterium K14]|nr:hypothetical protein [Puniceicoccaceae bacterium K14]
MILYIDCESPDLYLKDPELAGKVAAKHLRAKYRIENISGKPCLIVRFDRLSADLVATLKPDAVICSGYYTDLDEYSEESLKGLAWLLREVPVPTLTICGSFQLMGQIWGSRIGPMGPIPVDTKAKAKAEADADVSPGMAKMLCNKHEIGYLKVSVEENSDLFCGLPNSIKVRQNHYWEVKDIPNEFVLIGQSEVCPIQGLVHKRLPLCGVQFHAEEYNDEFPDGKRVLENFLNSAIQNAKDQG